MAGRHAPARPRVDRTGSAWSRLRLYVGRQASSPARYVLEQAVTGVFGWIPTPLGMIARAGAYRSILRLQGVPGIERGIRLRFAS